MTERQERYEVALALMKWGYALQRRFTPPRPARQNERCDHYWLYRRGGACPYCREHFRGMNR